MKVADFIVASEGSSSISALSVYRGPEAIVFSYLDQLQVNIWIRESSGLAACLSGDRLPLGQLLSVSISAAK